MAQSTRRGFGVARLWIGRMYSSSVSKGLPDKKVTLEKFKFSASTHSINDIDTHINEYLSDRRKKVTLNGHIHRKPRIMASKSFAELRDSGGGIVQLVIGHEGNDSLAKQIKEAIPEDSVSCSGYVKPKQRKEGESATSWELEVDAYQVLNHSNLDAARLDRLKHSSAKDLPPQYRYLQLRMPFYQKALKFRSDASLQVRKTLIEKHAFTEIETPLLFKSTPEGAREFVVPTRTEGKFYALPQSPQQYKQILMSSGITRYFQIAKCFRDEDLRSDRQPEFTQIDLEMSFINDKDQVLYVVENLIRAIMEKVRNLPLYRVSTNGLLEKVNWESASSVPQLTKLTYNDALSKYGIDKPNLKYELEFEDISDFFALSKAPESFSVVEVCVLKNLFDPSKQFKLPKIFTDPAAYPKRKPIILTIKNDADSNSWYQKLVEKGALIKKDNFSAEKLKERLSLEPGDVIAISSRQHLSFENPTPLGKFRQIAISQYPDKWRRRLIDESTGNEVTNYDANNVFVGSWVVDFPLFSPTEIEDSADNGYPSYDDSSLMSTHHPFTMAKLEDYDLLVDHPLKVRGEHYDLVINGVEVGGGSRRVHDAALQKFFFKNILKIQNYEALFGHLLKALSMGCPPHAGLAIGFDRLCAMLVGSSSIKDVIAFPKNQSGVDSVVDSPSNVQNEVLSEYHVKIKSS
ncbi:Piso0_001238 [Millerozyma farinosa CBS 7064]|uniref:Piso0_001238 protein n=1 Tax=Pichia sorbitophila (strain ATCC MYA-4447 / BCRC 22081 / CBS 7064 / NBRC 10061 / NRRL Y-12695) TaxID=559304 RepID=G8YDU1_PICSO|nr:Piso0_001238 [Millerozyma farinosa CBS 7064]